MKYIRDNDFCEITTDKFEKEGVKQFTRVYIAGSKALPESADDPYTQRIKFLVHLVKDKHVQFGPIFLMDPRSLKLVKPNEQKKLAKIMQDDLDAVGGNVDGLN